MATQQPGAHTIRSTDSQQPRLLVQTNSRVMAPLNSQPKQQTQTQTQTALQPVLHTVQSPVSKSEALPLLSQSQFQSQFQSRPSSPIQSLPPSPPPSPSQRRQRRQQMVGVLFLCLTLSTASLLRSIIGNSSLTAQRPGSNLSLPLYSLASLQHNCHAQSVWTQSKPLWTPPPLIPTPASVSPSVLASTTHPHSRTRTIILNFRGLRHSRSPVKPTTPAAMLVRVQINLQP